MYRKSRIIITLFFTLVIAGTGYAQKPFALKHSKMTVQGTSTLHDWESEATKVAWKGSALTNGNAVASVKDIEITVLVQGIKSTKGKTMDTKTWEAFTYNKNPNITYKLGQASALSDGTIRANGNLTMAGVTKPITLTVKSKVLPNGDVQLTGSHKMKMTDFKMEKPTAVMGTIKVEDEVTVNFDLTITPSI